MKKDLQISGVLILVAILSRLIPHDWNFTAMGAVAIASGFLIDSKKLRLVTPIVALLISDFILSFYQSTVLHNTFIFVVAGYLAMSLVSFGQSQTRSAVFKKSILASLAFFLISNFGVWIEGGLYPQTVSGLAHCYEMAIPFFKNELLANLFFTPVLVYLIQFKLARVNSVA